MIIILSVKEDPHVKYVEKHLKRRDVDYIIISPAEMLRGMKIIERINNSCIETSIYDEERKRWIGFEEVKAIWYRRPLDFREVEINAGEDIRKFVVNEAQHTSRGMFANYEGFWVNDPIRTMLSNYKLHQLMIAREVGFAIPDTIVTTDVEMAEMFYKENDGEIVHKAQTTPIFKVNNEYRATYTTKIEKEHVGLGLLNGVVNCPSLFQRLIEKEFEVRVTVFGDKIFSLRIDSQVDERSKYDWRKYQNPEVVPYSKWNIPKEEEKKCLELLKKLGLVYGAFDFIVTKEGEYIFLEVNPHGQWVWVEEYTGMPLSESLVDLLENGGTQQARF